MIVILYAVLLVFVILLLSVTAYLVGFSISACKMLTDLSEVNDHIFNGEDTELMNKMNEFYKKSEAKERDVLEDLRWFFKARKNFGKHDGL